MGLIKTFEKEGNFLFRYRGQFPVILFLMAIPFVSATDYFAISVTNERIYTLISFALSFLGFLTTAILTDFSLIYLTLKTGCFCDQFFFLKCWLEKLQPSLDNQEFLDL